uniref:Secreted protein n=1 Tax=Steinernema glaseri TaxID=37863 RepID=A0A1I7ZJD7_9BILA
MGLFGVLITMTLLNIVSGHLLQVLPPSEQSSSITVTSPPLPSTEVTKQAVVTRENVRGCCPSWKLASVNSNVSAAL